MQKGFNRVSGAQIVMYDEKTRGSKSPDKIPLSPIPVISVMRPCSDFFIKISLSSHLAHDDSCAGH
jgi:hypothetical protein